MTSLLIVVAIAIAIAVAGYWLTPKSFSRTIVTNALSAVVTLLAPMLDYLVGFPWQELLSTQNAMVLILIINLVNIFLRFQTAAPIKKA